MTGATYVVLKRRDAAGWAVIDRVGNTAALVPTFADAWRLVNTATGRMAREHTQAMIRQRMIARGRAA